MKYLNKMNHEVLKDVLFKSEQDSEMTGPRDTKLQLMRKLIILSFTLILPLNLTDFNRDMNLYDPISHLN